MAGPEPAARDGHGPVDDGTGPVPDEPGVAADEARLTAEIEELRVALESATPPGPEEMRHRMDQIADLFLDLYGEGRRGPAVPET